NSGRDPSGRFDALYEEKFAARIAPFVERFGGSWEHRAWVFHPESRNARVVRGLGLGETVPTPRAMVEGWAVENRVTNPILNYFSSPPVLNEIAAALALPPRYPDYSAPELRPA